MGNAMQIAIALRTIAWQPAVPTNAVIGTIGQIGNSTTQLGETAADGGY